ncbi:MAG: hypothetical protein QM811_31290 [Pirellulales bacterium]
MAPVPAIQWMGKQKTLDPSAIELLVSLLGDERLGERACDALRSGAFPAAVDPLIKLLNEKASEQATIRGLKVLETLGCKADKATPELLRMCRDDRIRVRFYALEALTSAATDNAKAVSALKLALRDASPQVRGGAVACLGRKGADAREAVPDLTQVFSGNERHQFAYAPDAWGERPLAVAVALAFGKIGPAA